MSRMPSSARTRQASAMNSRGLSTCSKRWLARISDTVLSFHGQGWSRSATRSTPGKGTISTLTYPGAMWGPQPRFSLIRSSIAQLLDERFPAFGGHPVSVVFVGESWCGAQFLDVGPPDRRLDARDIRDGPVGLVNRIPPGLARHETAGAGRDLFADRRAVRADHG